MNIFRKIVSLIVLTVFTFSVCGVDIYHHFCSSTGRESVSFMIDKGCGELHKDKVSCCGDTHNASKKHKEDKKDLPDCCKQESDNCPSIAASEECCTETITNLKIDEPFNPSNGKLILDGIDLVRVNLFDTDFERLIQTTTPKILNPFIAYSPPLQNLRTIHFHSASKDSEPFPAC